MINMSKPKVNKNEKLRRSKSFERPNKGLCASNNGLCASSYSEQNKATFDHLLIQQFKTDPTQLDSLLGTSNEGVPTLSKQRPARSKLPYLDTQCKAANGTTDENDSSIAGSNNPNLGKHNLSKGERTTVSVVIYTFLYFFVPQPSAYR